MRRLNLSLWPVGMVLVGAVLGACTLLFGRPETTQPPAADPSPTFGSVAQPLLRKYCLDCHSTKAKKGSLDLERFTSVELVRKDLKPWQQLIEMIEAGEMPPRNKPQPTAAERQQLLAWVRGFLDAEARARAGDPGDVPLRRLSNAEYDTTIRALTGVDLRPTREFPADGAAGEGFTNAAEALTDISPALFTKYLNAAKDLSEHAVLLPDGFRFSLTRTRRDWTNESIARLRTFYARYTGEDGRLPLLPYLTATVRHRAALMSGKMTLAEVARQEKLEPKYLDVLWQTLTDSTPSDPLDRIRAHWRQAEEKDVGALAQEITAWQKALWKFVPVGSYRDGNTIRQVANDPAAVAQQPFRVAFKPDPAQTDVVLYLATRTTSPDGSSGPVLWQRPRFEGAGQAPLLLRDYARFGPAYEVDYSTIFTDCSKYLTAAAEVARDRSRTVEDLARTQGLDSVLLKRWVEVLALGPVSEADPQSIGRQVPLTPLVLLDEKTPKNDGRPAINGWRRKGADLPSLVTNASDKTELIPGKIDPHRVTVHPTPTEFVAVTWKSSLAGKIRVAARVAHVHPACGNGVAWWLEHRRADRAAVLGEGFLDLGAETKYPERTLEVAQGDLLVLAVDARNGDHVCDLTEIGLTITAADKPERRWDLASDIANSVLDGNPHNDTHGQAGVWSFVRGPARPVTAILGPVIPPDSLLGRWRLAAADPTRKAEAAQLAGQVQTLLTGHRPDKDKSPDRILYDRLVAGDSILTRGLDLTRYLKPNPRSTTYSLPRDRFGRHPDGSPAEEASLVVAGNTVTEVRLPAALFRDREFVVEGKVEGNAGDRVMQFQVLTTPPPQDLRWDGKSPVVAQPNGAAYRHLLQGYTDFRACFPEVICFPRILPDDEVVCLKMYHREDEPLARLFLDEEQRRHLDRLWEEQRFISQQPVAENAYLPQFIGFVTQDQPKELLAYFEGQRGPFRKRAEDFLKELEEAGPKQLDVLLDFAARAYRRPLTGQEKTDLLALYRTLRDKGVSHDEAFRGVLARVMVSPAFLFRIEKAPAGKEPGPVNDWELATRLSYFLWSSPPDDELRRLAAAGRLRDLQVLAAQTRRLLEDDQVRSLAVEFGTQWLHVRGFDEHNEKNEKLFPTFDAPLRRAINEESVLFFQDLFQHDRAINQILDADYTFLNDTLARHYAIPGVTGAQFRRVEGVRKYGRGGILGLASVQATQSGASRTSPVLRGNWVVETLLGEKLPRPPANVPQLPEQEGGADHLTMRQQVEKHTRVAECAVCHQRIDPFGFALERYDPIGRLREKDLGGLTIETHTRLKDGTEFDGIGGLRSYLLTKKKDVIVRLFCRKLLGYALGRAVTLSDQALIDEMVAELERHEGRLSFAVLAIVRSPQFRMIRGMETAAEH
jgi:hypothetical protein